MNKESYDLTGNPNHMEFQFVSAGPNGKIKKAIIYTLRINQDFIFYNLGFGDLNDETGTLDDLSQSNNGDRDKILATVAQTVLEFTNYIPGAIVYAEGSTPARTRLYQMGLASSLEEIEKIFDIYGLVGGEWLPFERNVNYNAFMVYRKY